MFPPIKWFLMFMKWLFLSRMEYKVLKLARKLFKALADVLEMLVIHDDDDDDGDDDDDDDDDDGVYSYYHVLLHAITIIALLLHIIAVVQLLG